MDIEEVPKIIETLLAKVNELETSIMLMGFCPHCGSKIEPQDTGKYLQWECKCQKLKTFISKEHIAELKNPKP